MIMAAGRKNGGGSGRGGKKEIRFFQSVASIAPFTTALRFLVQMPGVYLWMEGGDVEVSS